jgi:hypothetical protein
MISILIHCIIASSATSNFSQFLISIDVYRRLVNLLKLSFKHNADAHGRIFSLLAVLIFDLADTHQQFELIDLAVIYCQQLPFNNFMYWCHITPPTSTV